MSHVCLFFLGILPATLAPAFGGGSAVAVLARRLDGRGADGPFNLHFWRAVGFCSRDSWGALGVTFARLSSSFFPFMAGVSGT